MDKANVSLKELLQSNNALLAYFSHDNCNVCKVLKPKVEELCKTRFAKIKTVYFDTIEQPQEAAQLQIFAVPTILVFFEGKEYFKFSRSISIQQLEEAITRPYQMIYNQD